MTLSLGRYTEIRKELIRLHNILNNRIYPIRLTPAMMMTVEELRNRETNTRDGVIPDYDHYEEYQEYRMNCPRLIEVLPNLVSERDLGFSKPNEHIIEIFESAQDYLRLWVELVSNTSDFRCPPLDELRDIEWLAYTIYPEYKKIKTYFSVRNFYTSPETQKKEEPDAFLSLAALFGMTPHDKGSKQNFDFVSYLEGLGIDTGRSTVSQEDLSAIEAAMPTSAMTDGLFTPQPEVGLPDWTFKR